MLGNFHSCAYYLIHTEAKYYDLARRHAISRDPSLLNSERGVNQNMNHVGPKNSCNSRGSLSLRANPNFNS